MSQEKFLLEMTDCVIMMLQEKSPQTQEIHPPSPKPCLDLTVGPQQLWLTNQYIRRCRSKCSFPKDSDKEDTKQRPNINPKKRPIITRIRKSVHGIHTPDRERPSAGRSILQERAFLLQSRSF